MRAAIAAAKNNVNLGDPASKPMNDEVPFGMVLCPHCGRKFSEKSGSRHIIHCENTKARPKGLAIRNNST